MAHEQIGIGWDYTGAHGHAFDLDVMMGVEGEVVVMADLNLLFYYAREITYKF